MSRLERFLILGILFLGTLRVILGIVVGPQPTPTPVDAVYDWTPDQFTRRGIPAKLTLMSDGRVPDRLSLTDTQKAFVYAAMMDSYDGVLTRALRDCPANIHRDITRWQAQHAETIADATRILGRLAPGRENARMAHDKMPQDIFVSRICPTIDRYIRSGSYEPHPEAVDRLAQAASHIQPQ